MNEPWRRISDLVGANAETRDPQVRKRCVKKLVAWIDRKVSAERAQIEQRSLKRLEYFGEWGGEVSEWRRVALGGRSVEGICFQLGMKPQKLNSLLREVLGISAGELLDGFKIRGLKKYLVAQLREAACRLWGRPGYFAVVRCHFTEENDEQKPHPRPLPVSQGGENSARFARRGRRDAGDTAGKMPALRKRSRYFRTRAEEFWGVLAGDEKRMRVSELLGMLDRLREENDFLLESFAVVLGFESVRDFRKACLNVMGRTMTQLERILAHEVVNFYLASEERELRKFALGEDVLAFRAREVYGSGEEAPREPFMDRWSTLEYCKPEWLEKMIADFGLGIG